MSKLEDFKIVDGTLVEYTGHDEHIEIPEGVISIADSAFANNKTARSIFIPSTTIGLPASTIKGSFGEGCALEAIYVSEDNPVLSSKDGVLFNKTQDTLYEYPPHRQAETYDVPDGVKKISEGAFSYTTNLKEINIPESTVSLGYTAQAFSKSFLLEKINISPENPAYSSIDGVLFNKAQTALIKFPQGKDCSCYAIPEGVIEVGPYSFADSRLNAVVFPKTIKTVGDFAFVYTDKLSVVAALENAESIKSSAFDHSAVSREPNNWRDGVLYISNCAISAKPELMAGCKIAYDTKVIADGAFIGTKINGEVMLPETLTTIGRNAFMYQPIISRITIPKSVENVGDWAFAGVGGQILAPSQEMKDKIIESHQGIDIDVIYPPTLGIDFLNDEKISPSGDEPNDRGDRDDRDDRLGSSSSSDDRY
jgi:lactocepin